MPEVSIDGFSIREYTAKMRSVDVVKCCPLDDDDVKAKLPPIEVKKFRWWRDVLVSDKDYDDDDVVVPVAKIGTTDRKMIKSVKGKTRVQKKRSIADIFAVTPQVERIDDEEENDNIVVANEGKTVLSYQNVNAIGNGKSKRRSTVKTKREKTIASKLKEVKKTIVKDKKFKQKKKVNSGCSGLLIRKKLPHDVRSISNPTSSIRGYGSMIQWCGETRLNKFDSGFKSRCNQFDDNGDLCLATCGEKLQPNFQQFCC